MYSADGENKNIFGNGLGHFGMGRSSNIIIKGMMACWSAGWLGAVETGLYEAPTFSAYLSADSWWFGNAETFGGCHIFSFLFFFHSFPPSLSGSDHTFFFPIARIFFLFIIFFLLPKASQPAQVDDLVIITRGVLRKGKGKGRGFIVQPGGYIQLFLLCLFPSPFPQW